MLYFIGFILVYAVVNAKVNQLVIDKKDWHLMQWVKVALVGTAVTAGAVFKIDDQSEFLNLLFIFSLLYWIVFDLSLNLFRGLKWYYVGTTAWLDKHLKHWQFLIKASLLFFAGLILMYYI